LIRVSNFLDSLCYFMVKLPRFYQSDSSLSSFISSEDHISLFACDNSIFIRIDNNCMGNKWGEAINMYSKLYFYKITFLDICWVFGERGIISADFVDRNSGGKGDALKGWFFVINFRELFIYLVIWPETQLEDLGSNSDFFDEFGKNI